MFFAFTSLVLEINQRVSGATDDQQGASGQFVRPKNQPDRDVGRIAGHGRQKRERESRAAQSALPSGGQDMRGMFYSTLSQVVELGIFAAAAGALAVGMMHLR
jgi:hypothetical protein